MTDRAEAAGENLLLVDSDAIGRSLIADYLRGCGYHVIEASSFAEAVIALGEYALDIVVSDVELPDGSGFGLAAWIRANRPGIEVILTTSVERAAQTAGELCDDGPTLGKPYHPQQLVDQIKRLRARRQ